MKTGLRVYITGHYFSVTSRLYGWLVTVFSVVAILNGALLAFLILPTGFVTQLLYRYTAIDLDGRTYKTGVRFLGITFGKLLPLPDVNFLYLNKNSHMQTAKSLAATMRFRSIKYDGYLKLADNTKLHLVHETNKQQALQKIEQISEELGIEFRDQTDIKFY